MRFAPRGLGACEGILLPYGESGEVMRLGVYSWDFCQSS